MSILCFGCGVNTSGSVYYTCTVCDDFILCSLCNDYKVTSDTHESSHPMRACVQGIDGNNDTDEEDQDEQDLYNDDDDDDDDDYNGYDEEEIDEEDEDEFPTIRSGGSGGIINHHNHHEQDDQNDSDQDQDEDEEDEDYDEDEDDQVDYENNPEFFDELDATVNKIFQKLSSNTNVFNSPQTYTCPYCNQKNLTEEAMVEHVTSNHSKDKKQVVCPICVSKPGGDPNYYSKHFPSHLNLNHKLDSTLQNKFLEDINLMRNRDFLTSLLSSATLNEFIQGKGASDKKTSIKTTSNSTRDCINNSNGTNNNVSFEFILSPEEKAAAMAAAATNTTGGQTTLQSFLSCLNDVSKNKSLFGSSSCNSTTLVPEHIAQQEQQNQQRQSILEDPALNLTLKMNSNNINNSNNSNNNNNNNSSNNSSNNNNKNDNNNNSKSSSDSKKVEKQEPQKYIQKLSLSEHLDDGESHSQQDVISKSKENVLKSIFVRELLYDTIFPV
ncbi:hypothetical protein CYY_009235 [Polysphondylium violaceum]|uniref:C2H2-type domain-containing protein n=1 Tax=Polysphondylium violaceum TaxID=133409 RepID=A0A8J4PLX1_9MYCE|nr:hypothetical protein CYY_009235 [Polysphondylium violaceum]